MTGSYGAAGLVFLGLFLLGGAYSLFKQGVSKAMSVVLVLLAGMALFSGVTRW